MIDLSFSWDDGSIHDIKMAELYNNYDLSATFFIPTKNNELKILQKSDVKSICEMGMDLGGHTENHIYLDKIHISKVEQEILSNKFFLEDLSSKKVDIFCYPGGKFNDQIQTVVSKHFLRARTAKTMCFMNNFDKFNIDTTFHFFDRGKLSMFKNLIQNNPLQIKDFIKTFNLNYFQSVNKLLIDLNNSQKVYKVHIWGHSWEINKYNLWKQLEDLLILIKNNNINVTSIINEIN